jgi:hypothetical protein
MASQCWLHYLLLGPDPLPGSYEHPFSANGEMFHDQLSDQQTFKGYVSLGARENLDVRDFEILIIVIIII